MGLSPIRLTMLSFSTGISSMSVWTPAVPKELLTRAWEHLCAEGGSAKVCFEFNLKDYRAQNCRVIVEGARKDLT